MNRAHHILLIILNQLLPTNLKSFNIVRRDASMLSINALHARQAHITSEYAPQLV